MALARSDTEYLMDMLGGMFGAPVFSDNEGEPIRSQMIKRAVTDPVGNPSSSKLSKCSEEVEYITHPQLFC